MAKMNIISEHSKKVLTSIEIAKYSEELRSYLEELKNNNEIVACYWQGKDEEFVKGVSDYDLIVITRFSFDYERALPTSISRFDISFYPSNIWKDGIYIKPLFPTHCKPIFERTNFKIENFWKKKEIKLIYLSHIIDYSFLIFFSWLNKHSMKLLSNGYISQYEKKEILKRISGLRYLTYMYNLITRNKLTLKPFEDFFLEINKLRKTPTDNIQNEIIKSYTRFAYENLLFPTLLDLIEFINRKEIIMISEKSKQVDCFFVNGRVFASFMDRSKIIDMIERREMLDFMMSLYKVSKENILVLPIEFSYNLIEYSKGRGNLSSKLKKDIYYDSNVFEVNPSYQDVIMKKRKILNKWALYVKKNKIEIGFRPFEYRYGVSLKDFLFETIFRFKKSRQIFKLKKVMNYIKRK